MWRPVPDWHGVIGKDRGRGRGDSEATCPKKTWKTPGAAREATFFTPGGPLLASGVGAQRRAWTPASTRGKTAGPTMP